MWASGVTFTTYGVPMGVRVTQAEVMDGVLRALPPGWRARSNPLVPHMFSLIVGGERGWRGRRDYHVLYEGGARLARSFDLEEVLATLETALLHRLSEAARRHVILNAAAVEWKGRAIVIMTDGRPSLVRALVRAGARLYADGVLVLDRDGLVHPYPRSIPAGGHRSHEWATFDQGPVPVGTVVVVTRNPRGEHGDIEALSNGQGLLALLRLAPAVRNRPKLVLETLTVATRHARFLKSRRGDNALVARALLGGSARPGSLQRPETAFDGAADRRQQDQAVGGGM